MKAICTKVGIYFWGCNKLDRLACEYLILSLNREQSVFEFEVHTPESFTHGPDLRGKVDFDSDKIFYQFKDRLSLYQSEIYKITSDPNNIFENDRASLAEYSIAIIEKKVKDEFYYVSEGKLAIISIGDWKKKYAPPSVLEFLLSTAIGAAVNFLDPKEQISVHIASRGCLFDYNNSLETARYSVLIKHICNSCAERITELLGKDFLQQIKKIVNRDWIGNPKQFGSVAYNLKRVFQYDLVKTKGFKASLVEKTLHKLSDVFAESIKNIFLAIVILFLSAMGLTNLLVWIKTIVKYYFGEP